MDLGSGEHGGFPVQTTSRLVRIDIQPRFKPDVAADAQQLPFRDAAFDGILAMSVLEHVPRPWAAVAEIHRVLRRGGVVLGYVPFMYPYHADPSFSDYYRFSDDALQALFSDFKRLDLASAGGYTNAVIRFAAGFTASQRHLLRYEKLLAKFFSGVARSTGIGGSTRLRGLRRTTTGFSFLAWK